MNSIPIHSLTTTLTILLFSLNCLGHAPATGFLKTDTTNRVRPVSKAAYDSLTTVLIRIGQADQYDRNQMNEVAARFGGDSHQMKALFRHIKLTDSLNLIQVAR